MMALPPGEGKDLVSRKMQNPQPVWLRILAKRRGKMKKKKLSTFIISGNYEEKKG